MKLELQEEQRLLTKVAREFLEHHCPSARVRTHADAPVAHDALWDQLAERGWLGLALPGEYGGGDGDLFDLGLFFEEAGRALLPTTFASTVHASLLIAEVADARQRQRLLPRLSAGELTATVASAELHALRDANRLQTQLGRGQDGWTLDGTKAFVPDGGAADLLVVVAAVPPRDGGGTAICTVTADTPGLEIVPHVTFGFDRLARITFGGVAVADEDVLVTGSQGWEQVQRIERTMTALRCVEAIGGAARVLEMTADYVKQREQFDRPIGSFQAVQHHVADMAIRIEAGRWAAYQAVWCIARELPAEREVAIAKAWCSDTYPWVTETAHQLFGGAGILADHDLHLYSERAKSFQTTFGGRDAQLRRLARTAGIGGSRP